MKIVIEKDEKGLHIDLGSTDWDHYEVIGMLEQTKHQVQKEIDRMIQNKSK
jgi:hypothetical protein